MKIVTVVIAAFAFLVIVGNASAGGYAGSRYEKSDCTYTKSTNVLYCEARFRQEEQTTANLTVPDASCASGLRLVQRTGLLVTTFRGWGYFTGRVPLAKNEIAGDEDSFEESWENFTDVDLGCVT